MESFQSDQNRSEAVAFAIEALGSEFWGAGSGDTTQSTNLIDQSCPPMLEPNLIPPLSPASGSCFNQLAVPNAMGYQPVDSGDSFLADPLPPQSRSALSTSQESLDSGSDAPPTNYSASHGRSESIDSEDFLTAETRPEAAGPAFTFEASERPVGILHPRVKQLKQPGIATLPNWESVPAKVTESGDQKYMLGNKPETPPSLVWFCPGILQLGESDPTSPSEQRIWNYVSNIRFQSVQFSA